MKTKCSTRAARRPQALRTAPAIRNIALCIALACAAAAPAAFAQAGSKIPGQPAAPLWQSAGSVSAQAFGVSRSPALQLKRFHAATLDLRGMQSLTAGAPRERADVASSVASTLTISLPHPNGGYQRFALIESPIMEAGLAEKHPEIKTYRGKGIDDPSATLRMDITPLGLHASVRSPNGGWYVDPYYRNDTSVYAAYGRADMSSPRPALVEGSLLESSLTLSRGFYNEGDSVEVQGAGFAPGASVELAVRGEGDSVALQSLTAVAGEDGSFSLTLPAGATGAYEISVADGGASAAFIVVDPNVTANASAGGQLRTYRLALVTDPSYAAYFGGNPANVTAAKVTLMNRVTQVYEDETSIRLVLIDGTDALNLDTAGKMTGANGPCGGSACFTTAQASTCGSGTLTRNRVVAGLLAGASNFDIGHIGLGLNGGGIASLGVVGRDAKAQGCTGIPTPIGDFYAVDYVAHEMGHQFSGNHTFNGTISNCASTNRNATTSVEPGSGSSVMAYAGICGSDNLQTHSDPYWSQRSFDEITTYTSGAENNLAEVQMGVLTNFAGTQQFQLSWNGNLSVPIVRGSNFSTTGIKAAIEGISGWPAGGTVTVSSLSDTAFTITFGGNLATVNVPNLVMTNISGGATGYVGEITAGGPTTRRGNVSATGNTPPVVSVTPSYTIPVRTPFVLSGSATDIDGDALTYMWEQNDRGASTGTGLVSNVKTNGPLFRQFGTRAIVSNTDTLLYGSPGENRVNADPTRVFPDMKQILANNTNAESGACPTAASTPTGDQIDCFSEFLPTAAYVGFTGVNASPASLNFKLTARDGRGGVNSATTTLVLAPGAGPFLVQSPNTAVTLDAGVPQNVSWSVANTNVAPVSTSNVKITLSTDGGDTWPYVLAASTPNTGSASVVLPRVATTTARIKVEAVGNVFFDVSNANFTINVPAVAGDVDGDGAVSCSDVAIVKAAYGKRSGQPGFDARADVVKDNVIDARDLSYVSQRLPKGTACN